VNFQRPVVQVACKPVWHSWQRQGLTSLSLSWTSKELLVSLDLRFNPFLPPDSYRYVLTSCTIEQAPTIPLLSRPAWPSPSVLGSLSVFVFILILSKIDEIGSSFFSSTVLGCLWQRFLARQLHPFAFRHQLREEGRIYRGYRCAGVIGDEARHFNVSRICDLRYLNKIKKSKNLMVSVQRTSAVKRICRHNLDKQKTCFCCTLWDLDSWMAGTDRVAFESTSA